jgi:hypothetical protein
MSCVKRPSPPAVWQTSSLLRPIKSRRCAVVQVERLESSFGALQVGRRAQQYF